MSAGKFSGVRFTDRRLTRGDASSSSWSLFLLSVWHFTARQHCCCIATMAVESHSSAPLTLRRRYQKTQLSASSLKRASKRCTHIYEERRSQRIWENVLATEVHTCRRRDTFFSYTRAWMHKPGMNSRICSPRIPPAISQTAASNVALQCFVSIHTIRQKAHTRTHTLPRRI